MASNQYIKKYELFSDMLNEVCSPVIDGWSTFESILEESIEELDLLRVITKAVYPNNENYFAEQIGREFNCEKNFEFRIDLKL